MATILVVDDSPSIRATVSEALTAAGHTVETGNDGVAALARLDALRPDLLIIDLEMPRLNGMSVLRFLKTSEALSEMPVLILTSKTDTNTVVQGINAGAKGLIGKPIDLALLLDKVDRLLGA